MCARATHDASTLINGLCAECHNDARADMILALGNISVPRSVSPCRYCCATIHGVEADRYGKAVCNTCVLRMNSQIRSIALYGTCDEFGASRRHSQRKAARGPAPPYTPPLVPVKAQ